MYIVYFDQIYPEDPLPLIPGPSQHLHVLFITLWVQLVLPHANRSGAIYLSLGHLLLITLPKEMTPCPLVVINN